MLRKHERCRVPGVKPLHALSESNNSHTSPCQSWSYIIFKKQVHNVTGFGRFTQSGKFISLSLAGIGAKIKINPQRDYTGRVWYISFLVVRGSIHLGAFFFA